MRGGTFYIGSKVYVIIIVIIVIDLGNVALKISGVSQNHVQSEDVIHMARLFKNVIHFNTSCIRLSSSFSSTHFCMLGTRPCFIQPCSVDTDILSSRATKLGPPSLCTNWCRSLGVSLMLIGLFLL
ncbi:hypothetical protein AFERRI_340015 [Acidithiobacillus ferrivorans]|uniref:Uncharacterized protein n=1 Tax=Acidithiobacillus ferrivorans TaxID=160808 RepID=A0A060UMJ8_9PROT|nr:hypothetical protein AFERRI_340015 [Acidithiobacillus ferrivorans]